MTPALEIAADVRCGRRTARSFAGEAVTAIRASDWRYNAITRLLEQRAFAEADLVDAQIAAGRDPGPLAGVPYCVKDLFDVEGLPTTAGAALRSDAAPARSDAKAISMLRAAGAVLVGTANMDEFAYGFATVNARYGTTRNPHDISRLAGGSSGGSAAAVAAGIVPLSLGSDTNGSIRVPASLTGIYGLKPTHDALPMEGAFPFVASFDDIGPFATSVADLRLVWEVLRGGPAPASGEPARVARLGGWFRDGVDPDLLADIDRIADAIGGAPFVELPEVARARSAAFLMTAAEGGALHLPALRGKAMAYDPATRDRLLAGAMLPASVYLRAREFRSWFLDHTLELFARYDVLICPATPCIAPTVDDPMIEVGGKSVPARAHLGILTQPLSFVGLPVIAAPLLRPGKMPLGIQIVGAPESENRLFEFADTLERMGLIGTSAPPAGEFAATKLHQHWDDHHDRGNSQ
ncbi:MAG: AtzE family amidohydrolase [Sphingomonadales bacterium]|nr:AtzE family amidohydrolase [Sphingomonadales bacterium]